MKLRSAFVPVAIMLFILSGCTKPKEKVPESITGLWVGTYTAPSLNQPPLFFSFSVYPDGTILYKSKGIEDQTFFASGTYQLTGDKFSYNVSVVSPCNHYSIQNGTANFDADGFLTDGINTEQDSGIVARFEMQKVK